MPFLRWLEVDAEDAPKKDVRLTNEAIVVHKRESDSPRKVQRYGDDDVLGLRQSESPFEDLELGGVKRHSNPESALIIETKGLCSSNGVSWICGESFDLPQYVQLSRRSGPGRPLGR